MEVVDLWRSLWWKDLVVASSKLPREPLGPRLVVAGLGPGPVPAVTVATPAVLPVPRNKKKQKMENTTV